MNQFTRPAYPRRGSQFAAQRRATGDRRKFSLNRSLLPEPAAYYRDSCGMSLKGSGAWRTALCPFHADSHPSLRINIERGGFCCMVCNAKGGDVIAFHMLRHNLPFIEACKALGAWEDVK